MIRKINARAEISTNTVITTVIAIIGIVLLGYAVSKIYDNFANQESKNAQKNLDSLMAKINVLQNGESTSLGLAGPNSHWYLGSWGKNDADRPEKCFASNCVCICNIPSTAQAAEDTQLIDKPGGNKKYLSGYCQKSGFCKGVGDNELIIYDIRIFTVESGGFGYISSDLGSEDPKNLNDFLNSPMKSRMDFKAGESIFPFIRLTDNLRSLDISRNGNVWTIASKAYADKSEIGIKSTAASTT